MDGDLFVIFARVFVFVPGMCSVCVEVWHILFVLNSLYSSFMFGMHIQDTIKIVLCYCGMLLVGRFFARVYLYIG